MSGDLHSESRGQAGVGIALSLRAEQNLVDWFPISARLCAVRLNGSTCLAAHKSRKRCLFVVSAYARTNSSSDEEKDNFYSSLFDLLRITKNSDIVILAGDMNAQVGRLSSEEKMLGGLFGVRARRNDNGDRMLQILAEFRLYLSSSAFQHKGRQCLTWRPPNSNISWTQIDHIAVSYRWRQSVKDCRSFWNTYLDSDHAIVRASLSLSFARRATIKKGQTIRPKLCSENAKVLYQQSLSQKLSTINTANDNGSQWGQISAAMHESYAIACQGPNNVVPREDWISASSVSLMKRRKTIPGGVQFRSARKSLKNKLTSSLRRDRERDIVKKAREMEKAFATGNSCLLFSLTRSLGASPCSVSEAICEKDGSLIHNQDRRINRWAEHFEEQFSWPEPTITRNLNLESHTIYAISEASPTEFEVRKVIQALKRNKSPGPDNLPPVLFIEGGEALTIALVNLLGKIWESGEIPKDWCKSIIVPIFKKGTKSLCDNHRGISLVSIASKILTGIIRRRLLDGREHQIREEQAGFRPMRGCIDHIFTLRQILEHRHTYRQPTIVVFLDLKAAFDSVFRKGLWNCLERYGVPPKYIQLLKALYNNSESRVRVYNTLSRPFSTKSGVRQGCPISPFLFNYVMDDILIQALRDSVNSGIELNPGPKLTDIEYADDVALLGKSEEEMQRFLLKLTKAAQSYGMRFAPAKCKVLLRDWVGAYPVLSIAGSTLEIVEHFQYLGATISSAPNVVDDVNSRIVKARLAFTKLNQIWRRKDVRLAIKGRLYNACVRSVLLYGSETWPLRAEDIQKLSVFDNRCLRSIARVAWNNRVSNAEIRQRIFRSPRDARSLEDLINCHRLRWLGHILRMHNDRLPARVAHAEAPPDWKKQVGGQSMTWLRGMKSLTLPLSRVGRYRLPGWGPRDNPTRWLRSLSDIASCRSQWRSCIKSILQQPQ